MIGTRQNLAASVFTAGGAAIRFVSDRPFLIKRIKFYPNDGVVEADEDVTIQAEGELLYSGIPLNLAELCIPSCPIALATGGSGPWVLQFDRPLVLDKNYPITITPTGGATSTVSVVLEGP